MNVCSGYSLLFSRLGRMGLCLLALPCMLAAVRAANLRDSLDLPRTPRSEHFLVYDARGEEGQTPRLNLASTNRSLVSLSPDQLLISAERIRRAVLRELALPLNEGGKIHLFLCSAATDNDVVTFVSGLHADGWRYRLEIPDRVQRLRLIRALVQATLVEFANRHHATKTAEPPFWLIEGLSMHLISSVGPSLIVESVPLGFNRLSVQYIEGGDLLARSRSVLQSSPLLTFEELAHPTPLHLAEENLEIYQSAAHFFVSKLLALPEGRAALTAMLRILPHRWNWELAFLQAFHKRFPRPLDVEKWWSVQLLTFTGRDPERSWPAEICLQHLRNIFLTDAEVRLTADTLPVRVTVPLHTVIHEWPYPLQKQVIQQKLHQLVLLRPRCPLQVARLVDNLTQLFHSYLLKRDQPPPGPETKLQGVIRTRHIVGELASKLDELSREVDTLANTASAANQANLESRK